MSTGGYILNRDITELVVGARMALGLSQRKFGELLGASERTAARWDAGQSSLGVKGACDLARHVHAVNPSLAAQLAAAASQTLESLGIVPAAAAAGASPVPGPPLPVTLIVDAVVCVAADALSIAPEPVRGALRAAFRRARELNLSLQDVEKALAPVAPKGKGSKAAPGEK